MLGALLRPRQLGVRDGGLQIAGVRCCPRRRATHPAQDGLHWEPQADRSTAQVPAGRQGAGACPQTVEAVPAGQHRPEQVNIAGKN